MPRQKKEVEKIASGHKLAKKIREEVEKIFPESLVVCEYTGYIAYSIVLRFTFGKELREWPNGIIENDPVYTIIHVGLGQFGRLDETGMIPEKLTIEITKGGSLYIWNDKETIKFQRNKKKTVDSPQKVIAWFKKYFTDVKKVLIENQDREKKVKDLSYKLAA